MPTTSNTPLVLVVDPDVEYAALAGRQLEWAGYEVLTTGEAAEAVELIETCRPDGLVLEATLPDASGYQLVRELREQPHNRLMPIVMISARAGKLDRDFAFTVGADDYVRKPFRYADLVARLALLAPAGPRVTAPVARRPKLRMRRPLAQPAFAG